MGGNIQVREGGRGRGQALEHGLRVPAIESGGGSQLWASALACVLSFLVVVLVCCLYCCMRATQARRKSGAGMLLTEFPARKCSDPFLRRTDHTHDDESCSSTISSYIGGFALRPTWACVYRTEAAR